MADTNIIKMSIKELTAKLIRIKNSGDPNYIYFLEEPQWIEILIPGSKVDIVQVPVSKNMPYIVPLLLEKPYYPPKDGILTYIVKFVPSQQVINIDNAIWEKFFERFNNDTNENNDYRIHNYDNFHHFIVRGLVFDKNNFVYQNLKVVKATVILDTKHPFVTLTFDKKIKCYVKNKGDNEYKLSDTNIIKMTINTLLFSLRYTYEEINVLLSILKENPKYIVEILMPGSIINIVQVPVTKDVPYLDPFSNEYTTSGNNRINTYITRVVANQFTTTIIDWIKDKSYETLLNNQSFNDFSLALNDKIRSFGTIKED